MVYTQGTKGFLYSYFRAKVYAKFLHGHCGVHLQLVRGSSFARDSFEVGRESVTPADESLTEKCTCQAFCITRDFKAMYLALVA